MGHFIKTDINKCTRMSLKVAESQKAKCVTSVHSGPLDSCRSSSRSKHGYTQTAQEAPGDRSLMVVDPPVHTPWNIWPNENRNIKDANMIQCLHICSILCLCVGENLHCHTNIADWADHTCRYWMSNRLYSCSAKWDNQVLQTWEFDILKPRMFV